MSKTNNQIRREEFEKRRVYKGTLSKCQAGYDCPVFMNCLLEINQLKKQLEEKDKVIDKIKNALIDYKNEWIEDDEVIDDINKFLEILERGKNGK